jgi:hypothetical protein
MVLILNNSRGIYVQEESFLLTALRLKSGKEINGSTVLLINAWGEFRPPFKLPVCVTPAELVQPLEEELEGALVIRRAASLCPEAPGLEGAVIPRVQQRVPLLYSTVDTVLFPSRTSMASTPHPQ